MSATKKTPDLIIADNQYLITEALKTILSEHYIIRDIVSCKNDLMHALRSETPKILIVDFSFLDFEGYDDLKKIRQLYPTMAILILMNNISITELAEFKRIGIKAFLHKNTDRDELFSCLDTVQKGKKYYSDIILDTMFGLNKKKETMGETSQLTYSEIEIVRLIAQGLTTKEIAEKKSLSFHTIMTHRKNILRKLGVTNASELTMYAIKTGIIDTIEYHI